MSGRANWTDEDMLEALDLRDHEGLTMAEVAKRMGRGRMSIVGLMKRVNDETDHFDPDGNQNGTMPRKWWKR